MRKLSKRLLVAAGLIVASSLIAGCYVPRGEEVSISAYGSSESGFEADPINVSESEFRMVDYVSSGGGIPDKEYYQNVSINLYSEDGRLLCVEDLGDMKANHGRLNVSFSTTKIPHYVIIASPDFWTEEIGVDYFQFNEQTDSYIRKDVGAKNELPVQIDREESAGSCSTNHQSNARV